MSTPAPAQQPANSNPSPLYPKPIPGIALLLAALSALGPFAIDTYLPSFHDIGKSLNASPLQVQQTLTAYMLPFAVMALWHGAIADAVGRRRLILVSLVLFGLSLAGCVFAQSIEHLWVLRAIQGITAGAGMVASRAIVRDLFDGQKAHQLMSQITMMFALAPALAPVIGGYLQDWFGWRSVFVFLTLLAFVLCWICWRFLPETLPVERRQSLHPAYLLSTYLRVLTSGTFLAACAGMILNFSGFFIYIMSAPVFLMQHLGLPATGFLWLFGPGMGGLMLGAWVSGRLAGKMSMPKTIGCGYILMGLAASANVLLNLFLPPMLPWSVVPLFFYTLGMSIAAPCLVLLALEPFAHQRGLAASCQVFLQTLATAFIAGVLAPALWSSTLTLAWAMACLLLLGAAAALWQYRITRHHPSP